MFIFDTKEFFVHIVHIVHIYIYIYTDCICILLTGNPKCNKEQ